MSKQMGIRPSDLYQIEDEVVAWSFDRSVYTFGNALESKLQKVSRDAKGQQEAERRVLREADRWLSSADDPSEKRRGHFADPMDLMSKR